MTNEQLEAIGLAIEIAQDAFFETIGFEDQPSSTLRRIMARAAVTAYEKVRDPDILWERDDFKPTADSGAPPRRST